MNGSGHGKVLMDRKIIDHDFFQDKEIWVRLMWMDMLLRAQYKEYTIKWNRIPFVLKRGQLLVTDRQLAEYYGTTQSTVNRTLKKMELAGMIERGFLIKVNGVWGVSKTASIGASYRDSGGTRITICNYNKFQFTPEDDDNKCES